MKALKRIGAKALELARRVWAKEPARVISYTAGAVVFAAAKAGIVLPELSVAHALEIAIPWVLGGEAIRTQVSPAP